MNVKSAKSFVSRLCGMSVGVWIRLDVVGFLRFCMGRQVGVKFPGVERLKECAGSVVECSISTRNSADIIVHRLETLLIL